MPVLGSLRARALRRVARHIGLPRLRRWIEAVILHRLATAQPDAALRFLFELDAFLYQVQGQQAIRYGGGVHTKHRHTRYHHFFADRIGPDDKVLDLGCGIGAVASDIAEKTGATVVAVDIDEHNLIQARRDHGHPRVEYRLGDVLRDPLESGFDVVVLSNVLEHLPGRPAFLARVVDRVRPSRVLIRVPLFERDWRIPLRKELGVEWRLDETHETEYTLESFAEEMDAAGLRLQHIEVRWGEIWSELVPAASASPVEVRF